MPNDIKVPKNNPNSKKKEILGIQLFYEPILSGDKDISYASCHHPSRGYAEFLDLSIGSNSGGLGSKRAFKKQNTIPLMNRNSPTILNTAFNGIDGKDDATKNVLAVL
ncbi:Di-haem cytochrome c peroxidase [Arenibacter nanhaiticus]|uniref:Di-haem cytochrome c peroxidase n=1 Tax=Arenibacter nanhaiticus TaxID=558155 RepID=A0A1M6NEV7_9FLAO|nr:cytochrome-c peroxidase [Arenibacter nanhaiticus]SHJ94207.1 Di-haem cytochrome c peroxidase [Arenibacter nanhaiticus]